MADINKNQQSDYMDALGQIQKSDQFQETMNLQNTKETNRTQNDREKATLTREKMQADLRAKQIDLEIARENKNKFDVKGKNDKGKK
jgi:hypothetical protein